VTCAGGPGAALARHLVLIPSYNSGALLARTVAEARQVWPAVWVVDDGSTDGSAEPVRAMAARDGGVRLLALSENRGKGAAIRAGLLAAQAAGFGHVLTMDADGQHPAWEIPRFMAASGEAPGAMVLCRPVFDASAPMVRVQGRRISNFWVQVETLWAGIGDSLSGFRVYPIAPLLAVMEQTRWMRRFDFDAEAAVRLAWLGVRPINLAAPVRYLGAAEGGVSHFRYGRDNVLLIGMHLRLLGGMLRRLGPMLRRRRTKVR
jgi:glycosyltransferase involved in cell wall biosynthesis